MNTVEKKLSMLHRDAQKDYMRIGRGVVKSIFRPMQPADFKNAYLPVSQKQGEALREIIIKNNFKEIVEFGTSFGISTIYLADGARETNGKVVSTELIESKAARAGENIKDAGLSDFVEILVGDAMQTLKDHSSPIDFLFLDGWKDLYLPLFKMLEPNFHSGTMIYADNMDMAGTQPYAAYLSEKRNSYSTEIIHGGIAYLSSVY